MKKKSCCVCEEIDCYKCRKGVPNGYHLASMLRDESLELHTVRLHILFREAKNVIVRLLCDEPASKEELLYAYDIATRIAREEMLLHTRETIKLLNWSRMEIISLMKRHKRKREMNVEQNRR